MIAQQARLGNITEASLNDSISRFKRFVNDFKQKSNTIIYDKKKDFSQVTSGITVPLVLNDPSFFDNSKHQNEPIVNTISPQVHIQSRNIYK